jgi:hypothetical protein
LQGRRQCITASRHSCANASQAMDAAVPSEHNRYQVVRLERLLREISG